MKKTKCPNCGKRVYFKDATCPKCGFPVKIKISRARKYKAIKRDEMPSKWQKLLERLDLNSKFITGAYHAPSSLGPYEKTRDISNTWQTIAETNPEVAPIDVVSQIAKLLSLSPITIATYGRASSNRMVKSEAAKAYRALAEQKKTTKY